MADGIVPDKRVRRRVDDDCEGEKQKAKRGDHPVRNELPLLSRVRECFRPFAIHDQL